MSEHITDQAIEAAAKATQEVCETYDPGGWTEEENWAIWARQILEAAAPHMLAPLVEALRVERQKVELLLEIQRTPEEAARQVEAAK